jgi:hypothetical protein
MCVIVKTWGCTSKHQHRSQYILAKVPTHAKTILVRHLVRVTTTTATTQAVAFPSCLLTCHYITIYDRCFIAVFVAMLHNRVKQKRNENGGTYFTCLRPHSSFNATDIDTTNILEHFWYYGFHSWRNPAFSYFPSFTTFEPCLHKCAMASAIAHWVPEWKPRDVKSRDLRYRTIYFHPTTLKLFK